MLHIQNPYAMKTFDAKEICKISLAKLYPPNSDSKTFDYYAHKFLEAYLEPCETSKEIFSEQRLIT